MTNNFIRISSGSPWEPIVGYCRAVRAGNVIEVSGTTAIKNGEVVCKGDAFGQTKTIFEIIERALSELGAEMKHVTRTRMYVTDISRWEEFGRAHGEVFGNILPATTMIEVKALIDPDMLIEIEVQAVVG